MASGAAGMMIFIILGCLVAYLILGLIVTKIADDFNGGDLTGDQFARYMIFYPVMALRFLLVRGIWWFFRTFYNICRGK